MDRIPTFEEIKEIYEASDIRGKALTLLFISSGVREGAIEGLKIKDYSPIEVDGKFVSGRLVVYNGDPESYITFISAEACYALDKFPNLGRNMEKCLKILLPSLEISLMLSKDTSIEIFSTLKLVSKNYQCNKVNS